MDANLFTAVYNNHTLKSTFQVKNIERCSENDTLFLEKRKKPRVLFPINYKKTRIRNNITIIQC